ncbi:MAG: ATP-binding protein [Firmicutes bacterium]|jgi:hypothetical protein|nr:ATP-binding protein [Bacillota bacterium]
MEELALHLLDLAQNSLAAGASDLSIWVREDKKNDCLTIGLADNGCGMEPEFVQRVTDPFTTTRTTRRVGLGLPLLAMNARLCDGDLKIESEPGKGTRIEATFRLNHWDRPPLGNIPATLVTILAGAPECNLSYSHSVDGREFSFSAGEVRKELGEIPLTNPKVLIFLQDYLQEALTNLYGGAIDGDKKPG